MAPEDCTHVCRGRATPAVARHDQRRFRGWISGWRAGRGACGAHGAALEDLPAVRRRAPLRHPVPAGAGGAAGRSERRFDRRQPERRLDQRRPRQDAERHGVRQSSARQPVALPSAPSCATGAYWAPAGAATASSRGSKGRADRSEDQDGGEPRCQPAAAACRLDAPAQAQAPRSVSRRDRTPPDRGCSRRRREHDPRPV